MRRSDEMTEVNLPELIRALGDRVPWRLLVAGAAALLGLFAAAGRGLVVGHLSQGASTECRSARTDPAFGNDVGFYVFTLPLLEDWRDLFMLILFLTAVVTGIIYWARGALDFRESPPRISGGAAAHFSVLLAVFFVQRAMNYWLARFELLLHSNGVVYRPALRRSRVVAAGTVAAGRIVAGGRSGKPGESETSADFGCRWSRRSCCSVRRSSST